MQKSSEKMRQKIGSACISLQTRSNRNCRIFSEAFIFTFFQCLAYSLLLLRRKSLGKKSCSGIGCLTAFWTYVQNPGENSCMPGHWVTNPTEGRLQFFHRKFPCLTFFSALCNLPAERPGGLHPTFLLLRRKSSKIRDFWDIQNLWFSMNLD